MPDWSYRTVFRPALFRLPFEAARTMALGAMGRLSRMPFGPLVIDLMGHMRPTLDMSRQIGAVSFSSAVGIGCAIDPHGEASSAMARFGGGFVEVGPISMKSLTASKPVERMDDSLSLSLPESWASDGLEKWCERLPVKRPPGVRCMARLIVARGTLPLQSTDECRVMIDRLAKHVDGFVVSTSNEALYAGWTQTEWREHVKCLVDTGSTLWIALRADLDQDQLAFVVDAAVEAGCTGIVVDPLIIDTGSGWQWGHGALEQVRSTVRAVRERCGAGVAIMAGGVHEPADALDAQDAGADLLMVDTGLVYSGPGLPKRINEAVRFRERMRFAPRSSSSIEQVVNENVRPALDVTRWTWFWTFLLGVGLLFGGLLALGIASTRVILPYDEVFVGMSREEFSLINPRLLSFMQHDRVTLAGTMLAVAVLYLCVSWYGIRQGLHWAMMSVLASALTGFFSFFLFLGFGYFDPFHAFVTAVMFQFLLMAWRGDLGSEKLTLLPNLREDRAWRMAQWGQMLFVTHGAILIVAGTIISAVGCTTVFVSEDLEFMDVCPGDLTLANPRLIPLIAHDRASFGGMLISTGVTVLLSSLWGMRQGARWQWWMLLLSGVPAYGLAIGVHLAVGYTSSWHLLPAYGGLAILIVGLALLWPYLVRRDGALEREWNSRLLVQ